MTQATELEIATGLATVIKGLAEWADADVTLNDWRVLDQAAESAPYVIIATADEFESRMDSSAEQTTWKIPVAVYEYFTDWTTTYDNLRARRQAILTAFNSNTNARSAGGLDGVSVSLIKSNGPVRPYYPPYLTADQIPEATPLYLYQELLFEVEVF